MVRGNQESGKEEEDKVEDEVEEKAKSKDFLDWPFICFEFSCGVHEA